MKKSSTKKVECEEVVLDDIAEDKLPKAIAMLEDIDYNYTLKIPKDRIAVVIGKDGEKKTELEKDLKVRINVDSKEGDISISGKDSLKVYMVHEVVRAIGRGFNPEIANLLLKQDYMLEIINILDYGKKNHVARLRGRIIGTKGKSRATIESLTETNVCVYGKTIGLIGEAVNVAVAKRAIESLLGGSTHSAVYKFLEKTRKEMKKREMLG